MAGESQKEPTTGQADPSVLTTQALQHEVEGLLREIAIRVGALRDVHDERFRGIDEATKVLHETVTRTPTDIQQAVGHLHELMNEKFSSVNSQFNERDTRQERESRDNKCVSADTLVLCADLTWRPAGDLIPGDELIGFDAESPTLNIGRGRDSGRYYRRATVTGNAIQRGEMLRVDTPRGAVRCTLDHPWLARKYDGARWAWIEAIDLKPGYQVMHMVDVWDVDRSYDAGWLAGMLDGEGNLTFKSSWHGNAKLSITQVAGPTADKISKALDALHVTCGHRRRTDNQNLHHQPREDWEIRRRPDIMKILGSIRPERLMVHADQVWEGFAIKGHDRMTTVTTIEPADTGLIASLSTSTATYIANGFAMHNTAVDAAFSAQKEAAAKQDEGNQKAIDKSERATNETIQTLGELFRTTTDGLKERQANLENALTEVRSLKQGGTDQRQAIYAFAGFIVALLIIGGVLVTVLAAKP